MRFRRLFLRLGVLLVVGVVGYFGSRMLDYVLTWNTGWHSDAEVKLPTRELPRWRWAR